MPIVRNNVRNERERLCIVIHSFFQLPSHYQAYDMRSGFGSSKPQGTIQGFARSRSVPPITTSARRLSPGCAWHKTAAGRLQRDAQAVTFS